MMSSLYKIGFVLASMLVLSSFTYTVPKERFPLRKVNIVAKEDISAYSVEKNYKAIMEAHGDKVFGIDISHYQGTINWDELSHIKDSIPISFVMARATYGSHKKDAQFDTNWNKMLQKNVIKGAYHYYRPDENSLEQAKNFVKHVTLKDGDFPPVLDIEARPRKQSVTSLRKGLKKWLDHVEKHYGVKPIIYTNDGYYKSYLYGSEFKDYILWVANYNDVREPNTSHWKFWQFSEKGNATGIKTHVDLNVFNGDLLNLYNVLINLTPKSTPKENILPTLSPQGLDLRADLPSANFPAIKANK